MKRLRALGVPMGKTVLARRGLDQMPACRPLREKRNPLRIVCIARLVAKKGILRQMRLYAGLRSAGLAFSVRVLGDGPLRERLATEIRGHRLGEVVELLGAVSHERVWQELDWADVLVHTGEVTASGDRDGLPNVVPEAMAAGVIVFTTPADGVLEAVEHETTGIVHRIGDVPVWQTDLRRVRDDDEFARELRENARRWVEENFDAERNAALLLARFREASEAARSQDFASAPMSFDLSPESDDLL